MLVCEQYESPMGTLWLTGRDGVLTRLSFLPTKNCPMASGQLNEAMQWLDGYFRGETAEPDFPIEPEGTPFQKLIWKLLLQIPFGETKTYGELAREAARILGKEKMSAQAVGQAVGHNPIAIIIPCHRCVGAGGKLTGYAYGLERKVWLLSHEQKQEEK